MADSEIDIDQQQDNFKSKTQLKQESLALQKLGLTLVELGQAALDKMPLDDELRDSVELARRINKKKDGYRRQIQFIGKLLRSRDTSDLERALAELQVHHNKANQKFHKLEQYRDQILSKGDDAINDLLNEHPHLDRQKLRQLYRQANKQTEQNKPPKAAREIFQYLKDSDVN